MPRDSSGNYTLPLGNPVVDGTIIDVNWANPTMNDIAVQLNNVLTRDGLLGPTGPFLIVDGTPALPGLAFISQNGSGLWRDATQVGLSVNGVAKQVWSSAGSQITGSLNVTGDFNTSGSVGGTPDLILKSSGTEKMRILADGKVGVGSIAPQFKLDVLQDGGNAELVHVARFFGNASANAGAAILFGTLANAVNSRISGFTISGTGGALAFNTAQEGTGALLERMRIDSNGDVGIGTSAPTTTAGYKVLAVNGVNGAVVDLMQGGVLKARLSADNNSGQLATVFDAPLVFVTNSNERMRIDATGNVFIGKTAGGFTNTAGQYLTKDGSRVAENPITCGQYNRFGSDGEVMNFYRQGVAKGFINVTGSGCTYEQISDYRLKDAIEDLQDSGSFIDALRPRLFTWKATGERSAGFIAHEFAEVSRSSVTGEKDGERMQSMQASTSEVLANIIAELKSLRLRVAALRG